MYLQKANHMAMCKKCRSRFKVPGNLYIEDEEEEVSIDEKPSFRIVWRCRSGHVRVAGFTRPVDFDRKEGE